MINYNIPYKLPLDLIPVNSVTSNQTLQLNGIAVQVQAPEEIRLSNGTNYVDQSITSVTPVNVDSTNLTIYNTQQGDGNASYIQLKNRSSNLRIGYAYMALIATGNYLSRLALGFRTGVNSYKEFLTIENGMNLNSTLSGKFTCAELQLNNNQQGLLFARGTTTEVNSIINPVNGLTLYNTTLQSLVFYNGTNWQKISHSIM